MRTYTAETIHDYDPYGKILRSFTKSQEKYLTTNHERDTETDLDYRGARFYDSDVVRFLSLDPLAHSYPSFSAYSYVAGNPLILLDPNGRDIIDFYTLKFNQTFSCPGLDYSIVTAATSSPQSYLDQSGTFSSIMGKFKNTGDFNQKGIVNIVFKKSEDSKNSTGVLLKVKAQDGTSLVDLANASPDDIKNVLSYDVTVSLDTKRQTIEAMILTTHEVTIHANNYGTLINEYLTGKITVEAFLAAYKEYQQYDDTALNSPEHQGAMQKGTLYATTVDELVKITDKKNVIPENAANASLKTILKDKNDRDSGIKKQIVKGSLHNSFKNTANAARSTYSRLTGKSAIPDFQETWEDE